MEWLKAFMNFFKGDSAGKGSTSGGSGGLLSSATSQKQGDTSMGMSAANKSSEPTAPAGMLDKFADFSDRYSQGQESNLGQFIKDTKGGNYAGSLGYASRLAQGAQQGAKPVPLIQLPQDQQRPVDDRYGRIYGRQRGY